jgi:hypothetical protein
VFKAAGKERPVVLVLDDLDCADEPSLALLRRVVRASAEGRLSILGTYRDADMHRGHPLTEVLADLRREHGLERIVLSGLSEEEIMAGRGDARGPMCGVDPGARIGELATCGRVRLGAACGVARHRVSSRISRSMEIPPEVRYVVREGKSIAFQQWVRAIAR